jgi:hypothetical protein
MSKNFLDHGQSVGYDFEKKLLIVTISEKMAKKMKSDGWDVGFEREIGNFIQVSLTDGES